MTEPAQPLPADPDEENGHGDGDTAETGDGDGDGEQTSEQAAAAAGSDELLKKADAANRRYHTNLLKILGEDPNRHECPRCEGLGVVWGALQPELELVAADDAAPCEKCNAIGFVLTGSKNPEQATKPCSACGGRGWQNVVQPVAVVTPITPPAPAVAPQMSGQWVPGRGFIPFGQVDPIIPDPNATA